MSGPVPGAGTPRRRLDPVGLVVGLVGGFFVPVAAMVAMFAAAGAWPVALGLMVLVTVVLLVAAPRGGFRLGLLAGLVPGYLGFFVLAAFVARQG